MDGGGEPVDAKLQWLEPECNQEAARVLQRQAFEEYFCILCDRTVMAVLEATNMLGQVSAVNLARWWHHRTNWGHGHGTPRALLGYDPSVEAVLREYYLSRDARRVERKKYGQRGARRRFHLR